VDVVANKRVQAVELARSGAGDDKASGFNATRFDAWAR
jgi:hypothetical protein